MRSIAFKCILVVLAFSTISGTRPALGSDGDQRPILSATDLEVKKDAENRDSVRTTPLDGNQDLVAVALPDGKHKSIPVELKVTWYKGTLVEQTDSRTTTKPKSWACYELQSKDKDVPYTWYMWSWLVLGRFKLFVTADGSTYLTYLSSYVVYLVDVSRPMDQADKVKRLNEWLNQKEGAGVQWFPVGDIIVQRPFADEFIDRKTTGHYASIYVTSLEKDGKGGFTLQLHGTDASRIYTLVTDKEAKWGWRLLE